MPNPTRRRPRPPARRASIEVGHRWSITASDTPPPPGGGAPLRGADLTAARADLVRKRTQSPRTDFEMLTASWAWRVPEGQEHWWHHLTLAATSAWQPAGPTTDLGGADTAARTAINTATPTVNGSHQGTRPTRPAVAELHISPAWIAAPQGLAVNDDDPLGYLCYPINCPHSDWPRAMEEYQIEREDRLHADIDWGPGPDPYGPAEPALWWSLRISAASDCHDPTADLDPLAFTAQVLAEAAGLPTP